MSDAEARAKAEEWVANWDSCPSRADMADSLAALLRAAGAGTWSKDRPTKPGWYLHSSVHDDHVHAEVVRVWEHDGVLRFGGNITYVRTPDCGVRMDSPLWDKHLWLGPIPEPR